ncbi:MAG TPA: pantoate--beta-alanine ligase [bacterium]|nr:pantoate--beta-alanine ligase [bacterium]
MKVISDPKAMQALSRKWKRAGKRVGFVPTMGALHEGHLALVRAARKADGLVAASIYVNPLQFGPQEDLKQYPRTLEADLALLKKEKVAAVFTPSDKVMYPEGYAARVQVTGPLVEGLCAPFRPGHFDGVATVVVKLLGCVQPTRLYLGQKDAQQALVLRQVIADLDLDVETVLCPIVREHDGLAMSSRNVRLTPEGRRAAPVLYRALKVGKGVFELGVTDPGKVMAEMRKVLKEEKRAKLQYLEAVETPSLRPAAQLKPGTLLALAAFIDQVRLIDNLIL